jgi:hypothetical protein
MKTRVMVLGASRYKFPQEGTGEIIEGCKVHFVEENGGQEKDNIGRIPQSVVMDYEFYEYISNKPLPALMDAELTVSMRSKKMQLKIVDFEFIAPIDFQQKTAAAQAATK